MLISQGSGKKLKGNYLQVYRKTTKDSAIPWGLLSLGLNPEKEIPDSH